MTNLTEINQTASLIVIWLIRLQNLLLESLNEENVVIRGELFLFLKTSVVLQWKKWYNNWSGVICFQWFQIMTSSSKSAIKVNNTWVRILVQVTIYRRLRIDDYIDQSQAYDMP